MPENWFCNMYLQINCHSQYSSLLFYSPKNFGSVDVNHRVVGSNFFLRIEASIHFSFLSVFFISCLQKTLKLLRHSSYGTILNFILINAKFCSKWHRFHYMIMKMVVFISDKTKDFLKKRCVFFTQLYFPSATLCIFTYIIYM